MYGRSPGIHNHETLWEPESRWSRYDAPRYGKHDDVPCGHCHPGCIDWRWPRPDSLLVESLEPALERGTFGPREKPTRRRTEPAVEQKFLFRSPQEASTELCVPSPPLRVRVGRFGCDDLQVSPPASKQPLLVPLKIPEVVFTYPSDVRHRKMMCDKGYKILTNLSRNTRTRPRPSPLANKTHGEFWKDGWLVQPRAASVRTAVLRDPAMHTRTFEPEPESQPPSNPQPLPKSQPLPAFNPPPALQPQPRRNIRRFVSFDLDDPSPREQQGSGLSSMNPVQRGLQETPPAPAPPAVASLMSEKPKLSPPSTPRTEVFFTMTSLGQRSAQDSTLMHSEAPAAVKEPKPVKPVSILLRTISLHKPTDGTVVVFVRGDVIRIYPTIRNAYPSGKTELQMELEFPASEDDDVSLAVKDGEGKELGRSKFVRAGSLKDKVVEFELDQDNQDEPIQSIGTINGTLGTQINDNWRVAARGKTSTLRRPPAWGAVTAAFRLKQLRNAKAKAKAEAPEEIRLSTPPSRSPRESSSGSVSGRPPPVRRFATVESVESCTSEPLDTVIQSSTAPELKVSAAAPPALKPTVLLVKEQAKALGVNRNLKETVVTKLSKERAKALGGTMKLKQTVKGPSEKRVVTQKDYLLKPAMPKTLQKLSPSERPQTLLAKTLQKPEHKEKPGVKAKTLQKIVGHKEKPGVKAKTLQKIVGHKEKPGVKAKTLQKPEHTDKSGVKAKTLQKPEHTDKSGVKAKTLEKPGHKEKPGVKSKTSQKPGHKEKPGVKAKTSQKPEHTEKPGVEAKTLEKPGHKEKPGVVTAKAPAAKTLKNLGSKGDTPVLFSEIHNASSDADAKGTNGKFKVPTRRPRQTTIELKKVKKNAGLGTKTFALTTGDVQRRKAVPKSIVVKKVNKIAVEPVASQGLRSKMRNIFRR